MRAVASAYEGVYQMTRDDYKAALLDSLYSTERGLSVRSEVRGLWSVFSEPFGKHLRKSPWLHSIPHSPPYPRWHLHYQLMYHKFYSEDTHAYA